MAWYSLLPPDSEYAYLESLLIKFFIACGLFIGAPGWSLVIYDIIVYIIRIIRFELIPSILHKDNLQLEQQEEEKQDEKNTIEEKKMMQFEKVMNMNVEINAAEDGNITTSGSESEEEQDGESDVSSVGHMKEEEDEVHEKKIDTEKMLEQRKG